MASANMQGTVLKGRWKIVKKIGQGAFGEIYSGADLTTQDPIAVKLERWDNKKAVLKMEVAVLKKLQHCTYACRYVHCGHFEDHNYLVMELLGENLSELRRRRVGGRLSLPTTVRLGVQMVRAVQAIHDLGYLHRDIKPSNFAMGLQPGRKDQCIMIDFGLTRKYRLPNGQIRPAREIAGFRGTARYASINSHLSKELSRRDDLWSVLYLLIEFLTGQLPWRKLKDKEEIGLLKIHFNSPELVRDLPPSYLTFMLHLQALDYLDRPDYDMLAGLLEDLGGGVAMSQPYDWEVSGDSNVRHSVSGRHNTDSIQYSSQRTAAETPGGGLSTNCENMSQIEDRGGKLSSEFQDSGRHNHILDSSIGLSASTPRLGTPTQPRRDRMEGGSSSRGTRTEREERERRRQRRAAREAALMQGNDDVSACEMPKSSVAAQKEKEEREERERGGVSSEGGGAQDKAEGGAGTPKRTLSKDDLEARRERGDSKAEAKANKEAGVERLEKSEVKGLLSTPPAKVLPPIKAAGGEGGDGGGKASKGGSLNSRGESNHSQNPTVERESHLRGEGRDQHAAAEGGGGDAPPAPTSPAKAKKKKRKSEERGGGAAAASASSQPVQQVSAPQGAGPKPAVDEIEEAPGEVAEEAPPEQEEAQPRPGGPGGGAKHEGSHAPPPPPKKRGGKCMPVKCVVS